MSGGLGKRQSVIAGYNERRKAEPQEDRVKRVREISDEGICLIMWAEGKGR